MNRHSIHNKNAKCSLKGKIRERELGEKQGQGVLGDSRLENKLRRSPACYLLLNRLAENSLPPSIIQINCESGHSQ